MNKTGHDNLLKVLKSHRSYCKIHEFSLQKDRRCTCGVEKAREELEAMREEIASMRAQLAKANDVIEAMLK